MAFVVKNDLQNFSKRLNAYNKKDIAERVADLVAKKGGEIANSNWGGSAIVSVSGEGLTRSIIAKDSDAEHPKIGYIEFGTGVKGKGTYEGKLPEQPIIFTAKRGNITEVVSLDTWVYNYRREIGWTEVDYQGRPAEMPMYNTGKQLREYVRTDLAKDLRENS